MTRELSCPRASQCAHGPTIRMTVGGYCADCGTTLRNGPSPYKGKAHNAQRAAGTHIGYHGGGGDH